MRPSLYPSLTGTQSVIIYRFVLNLSPTTRRLVMGCEGSNRREQVNGNRISSVDA